MRGIELREQERRTIRLSARKKKNFLYPTPPNNILVRVVFAPFPCPVCAGCGGFTASGPLHFHHSVRPAAPAISTPLRDFYLPRDQSVQPPLLPACPPDESARFPLAPRRPS